MVLRCLAKVTVLNLALMFVITSWQFSVVRCDGNTPQGEVHMRKLIEQLASLKVEGSSFGGPYVGISHNPVTLSIVAEGEKIVPLLIEELDTCGLDEAIFIVFCLSELHAKSAKAKIEELQSSDRFSNVKRDLTLDMQIKFFLRDVDSW